MADIDQQWMTQALALAQIAANEHAEIPVGAIVVDSEGAVIGQGYNRNITDHDPSAHAEMIAMREAGKALGNHRLNGCTVYVTLEPCAMCAMAMVHARVKRVVYAAGDPKTGAVNSVFDLLQDPRHNHFVASTAGICAEQASAMLSAFFAQRRAARKSD